MSSTADQEVTHRYKKLRSCWRRGPEVIVTVSGGLDFNVKIPLDWLERTRLNAWAFIQDLLSILVNESGRLAADVDGHIPLDLDAAGG